MIVMVDFGMHQELICISDELGEIIDRVQDEFQIWLYDKEVDHQYWIHKDGEKWGVNFRASAFVDWINTFKSDGIEKTKIIEEINIKPDRTIYF